MADRRKPIGWEWPRLLVGTVALFVFLYSSYCFLLGFPQHPFLTVGATLITYLLTFLFFASIQDVIQNPTVASEDSQNAIPAQLFRGFFNGSTTLHVLAIIYIVGSCWFCHVFPIDFRAYVLAILIVKALMFFDCWNMKVPRVTMQVFGDTVPIRFGFQTVTPRRLVFPVYILVLDSIVLGGLIARTGGVSSPFLPLYAVLSATGDIVLHRSKASAMFTSTLLVGYALGCTSYAMNWLPQVSEMNVFQLQGAHEPLRTWYYAFVAVAQGIFLLLVGLLVHRTATLLVEDWRQRRRRRDE